jgi:hypothetical protein
MKTIIFLCILIIINVYESKICRAIALGGGGDRGAYQVGVLKALVNHQRSESYSWNGYKFFYKI